MHVDTSIMADVDICIFKTCWTKRSYCVFRCSGKCWSGIPTDMIIEQTFLRSVHSTSGFTHGRSTTYSVFAKWLATMPLHVTFGWEIWNILSNIADNVVDNCWWEIRAGFLETGRQCFGPEKQVFISCSPRSGNSRKFWHIIQEDAGIEKVKELI